MEVTRLAIARPVVMLMAIAAIMLLGWRARMEMPAELDPKVELPIVNVITVYPGAGPEEVERNVSRPLEDALATVNNVTEVSSRSMENVSFVTVELKLGTDVDRATADLRSRVEAIRRDLPSDIDAPQVAKFDYNARPVLVLGVTGDLPLEDLRYLVDETIKPRLSQVPGLGSVTVVGGREREVQVSVDPDRLAAYNLSLLDLLQPLGAASRSAPAGSYAEGGRDVSVRVLGEYTSLDDIRSVPIPPVNQAGAMSMEAMQAMMSGARTGPTTLLRLEDVADVREVVRDPEQYTRVGRRDSISLILSRLSNANTVEVAEGVKHELAALSNELPSGVQVTVIQDNSVAVEDALEDINVTLFLGALLAIIVVALFLHDFKSTAIIACSIPLSIIATFIVMYFAGFSMNQMTMLALSLSVGILVDDSILVLECIHRHRAMGKPPKEAALDGRAEIGLADAANTFVDVVVFIPIAFMGGIVGQFFREFGITIAAATLASLYVSFTLTPMLAAHWFRREEAQHGSQQRGFPGWFNRRYERLEERYRGILSWALRHRLAVVSLGFGSLVGMGLLAWQVIGFDFTPSVDRGQVAVYVELPPGTSLDTTDAVMQKIEAVAETIPEVAPEKMLTSVGEIIGGFGSLPDRGPHFGQLTLTLIEKQGFLDRLLHPLGQPGKRTRTDEQVAAELRQKLEGTQDAGRLQVLALRGLTGALAPIQIGLYGSDSAELERVAAEVESRLTRVPELRNVDSSFRQGRPELQVRYDRERAEPLYVTSAELAGVVRTAIAGHTDFRYREEQRTYPIRVQLQEPDDSRQTTEQQLANLVVANRGATPITVGDIADVRWGAGPTKIMRSQRTRRVVLFAHPAEGVSLGAAQSAIERELQNIDFASVERRWEGDVDEMSDSAANMTAAILLAIALSYMLMAAVFNHVLHPLTIMSSVPMALVGGLLGLILTGTTMNIVSMIGIVMLLGLVAKNAILLVDYTNTLRAHGLSRTAALEAAGPVRLRPILMTTISTVLAMLPIALQIGRGSEMRSPMAIVVIGGLLLSTLLTLLVVPVVYTYFDDLAGLFHRRRSEPPATVATEPPLALAGDTERP